MTKRIAIIGAGVAGLAAAYDLTKAGHSVVIYEAAPDVGGLAAGFKAAHWDWTLEKYYHHWFQSDKHMLGLIEELGGPTRFFSLAPSPSSTTRIGSNRSTPSPRPPSLPCATSRC